MTDSRYRSLIDGDAMPETDEEWQIISELIDDEGFEDAQNNVPPRPLHPLCVKQLEADEAAFQAWKEGLFEQVRDMIVEVQDAEDKPTS